MTKTGWLLALAALALAAILAGWVLFPRPQPVQFSLPVEADTRPFSNQDYAWILNSFVNDQGLVDYRRLKQQRLRLDRYAVALARLDPQEFWDWKEAEQIAFWINAYNSLTLVTIINHYPIDPSFLRSLIFPRNSIRQIPWVWDRFQFEVMGQFLTLNQIEHEVLRPDYAEPRIHMALVCAAVSCPPLRREPFCGGRLHQQLDDQTRRFLSHPAKFRLEAGRRRIFLSPIFRWFGSDFVGTGTSGDRANSQDEAILNFVGRFLSPEARALLKQRGIRIRYLSYDWSLNESLGEG